MPKTRDRESTGAKRSLNLFLLRFVIRGILQDHLTSRWSRPLTGVLVAGFDRSRVRGAMLGLAVGNAQAVGMAGTFGNLLWTDPTASTYALGHSLMERRTLDPHDLLGRLTELHRDGAYCCAGRSVDLDIRTIQAIGRSSAGSENTPTDSSQPIALVRTLASTLFAGEDEDLSAYLAAEQCRITNPELATISTCVALAGVLRQFLLSDPTRDGLVEFDSKLTPVPPVSLGSEELLRRSIKLVNDTSCFVDAIVESMADPVSPLLTSITGMVAGARHGVETIPNPWLKGLPWKENLSGLAMALQRLGAERTPRITELTGHHTI